MPDFPAWLTPTKASPPRQQVSVLHREELLRQLELHLKLKLTVLAAPAGYGKSTLLTAWQEYRKTRDDSTIVWLTLDRDDDDPALIALYLLYAAEQAGLSLGHTATPVNGWSAEMPPKTLTGVFLASVTAHEKKVILILDNANSLTEEVIEPVLTPLFRYAPHNMHVALATRSAETMSLSSLRAQGELYEMNADALKFTPFEQASLLKADLNKALMKEVGQHTEGWPVAVQLIKSAITDHREPAKVLAMFSGTNRDIRDYIDEHIIGRLPSHHREFLLDASVLPEFDGVTADAIRGANGSAQLLQELGHLTPLVRPMEDREGWYRLHPMFREALHRLLSARAPKRLAEINHAAARHFMHDGHIIRAIRHALDANAPETAADILEQAGGILLWNREGMSRIRKAHELLPDAIVAKRPRIGLLRALVFLKDGHLNDARHIYSRILRQKEKGEFAPTPLLDYDLAVIAATLAVYEGTPLSEAVSTNLVDALNRFEQEDKQQVGFVYTILCVFNLQKGFYDEARRVAELAISHFQEQSSVFGETYIHVHLGVIATAQGKYDQAHDCYTKVQDSQRRHFIDDKDLRLVLNILLAEWHYEKDELATAERLLGNINRRLETGEAWYEIYATGYTLSTAITYRTRGLAACLALGDEACTYIRREGLKRLNRLVMANQVAYLCQEGKTAKARKLAQAHNLSFSGYRENTNVPHSVREVYAVVRALAVLCLAEGRTGEVVEQLEYFIAAATERGESRAVNKYELLTAAAIFQTGDLEAAFEKIEPVIAFVRKQGLLRFVLDETPFITPILEAYAVSDKKKEQDHVSYLLNHLHESRDGGNAPKLSKREQEVLGQLSEGHADKVIARHLDVSENTVRFHLKNIYSKLGVGNRLMAVNEASKRGLL